MESPEPKKKQNRVSLPKDRAARGVTRPAGNTSFREHRRRMLVEHHERTQWVYWMVLLLGVWMMVHPATFDYSKNAVTLPEGREVWLDLQTRVSVLKWNDLACGLLLIFFGWRALRAGRPLSLWFACAIGVWLNLAPLLFWAPTAHIYVNQTLAGSLLIALTILIPGLPNEINYMKAGPEQPPGWSYNPSSWPQRAILMALAFGGWIIARYLGAFQLGYIDTVWDPFFKEGTRNVLVSDISEAFPISDAGLGAVVYTLEFLMVWLGSTSRWRTPWMVTFFGLLVIPLGVVHVFLVISQPVFVGYWCALCLLAALLMLFMVPLEADEVVAMGQFMVRARKEGHPFWRTFWQGAGIKEGNRDERSPKMSEITTERGKVLSAFVWGMSVPWHLAAAFCVALWLFFAPSFLESAKSVADMSYLAGALVLTVSVIAMGEVLRVVRYFNILAGIFLLAAPWFMREAAWFEAVCFGVTGAVLMALSFPRGYITESYGSWDRFIV